MRKLPNNSSKIYYQKIKFIGWLTMYEFNFYVKNFIINLKSSNSYQLVHLIFYNKILLYKK